MSTDAMHASVTFLTWDQLCAAMQASCDEYETRFAAFLTASDDACAAVSEGKTDADELSAEMDSRWAACKAQSAMTGAIAAEMRVRQLRKDYGPTATEAPGA